MRIDVTVSWQRSVISKLLAIIALCTTAGKILATALFSTTLFISEHIKSGIECV